MGLDRRTMSSSPASVLVVALELGRVTPSVCGCNPNLSSTVHLIGDRRNTHAIAPAPDDRPITTRTTERFERPRVRY